MVKQHQHSTLPRTTTTLQEADNQVEILRQKRAFLQRFVEIQRRLRAQRTAQEQPRPENQQTK